MSRSAVALCALASALLLSGCTKNAETSAGAAPVAQQAEVQKPAVTEAAAAADAKPATAPATAVAAPEAPQIAIIVPPKPKPGAPHGPGFDMPLLDLGGYAPPRPMDVLKDAHVFTADHPEVATYIPCYCGCGNMGHKNNADCFVESRDKQGKVTSWVPHGAACAVCIDIAVESMRMRNSGASVSAIRTQIQNEYRPRFPATETDTPLPPPGK